MVLSKIYIFFSSFSNIGGVMITCTGLYFVASSAKLSLRIVSYYQLSPILLPIISNSCVWESTANTYFLEQGV